MSKELIKRTLSSLVLLPFIFFTIVKGSYYFNFTLAFLLFISIYEWVNMSKSKIYTFIGILFLILSFISIYHMRFNMIYGHMYLVLILIICVSSDIGGYIFGKTLQGPKLTKISPNKTYSGMIGSFILPLLIIYVVSDKFYSTFFFNFNIKTVLFILYVSAISQLGDLVISYFKRKAKLKNTGNLIPGHGGLLDRIDGIIFAYPLSYIIFSILIIDFI